MTDQDCKQVNEHTCCGWSEAWHNATKHSSFCQMLAFFRFHCCFASSVEIMKYFFMFTSSQAQLMVATTFMLIPAECWMDGAQKWRKLPLMLCRVLKAQSTQDAGHDAQCYASKWDLLIGLGVSTLHASNIKGKMFQFACVSRPASCVDWAWGHKVVSLVWVCGNILW